MNETKKRGRPTNAEREARNQSGFVQSLVQALASPEGLAATRELKADMELGVKTGEARAYALRVWSGQSNDLPRSERIERVMSALKGQNLPTEGIELP
jgi:hypothetical protein